MYEGIISELDSVFSTVMSGYGVIQATMIGAVVLLTASLLCCFLGYRLSRWVCGVLGAALGGALCAFVATSYLPAALSNVAALLAGIVGALLIGYLFFHLYQAMVFVICAGFGALLGSVPAVALGLGSTGSVSSLFVLVLIVCALLFGIAGILFFKPVMIILTGLGGFLAAPQLLMLAGMPGGTTMRVLVGAVLSAAGIAVQFATNRRRTAPGFRRQTPPDAAEQKPTAAGDEPGTAPDYASMTSEEKPEVKPNKKWAAKKPANKRKKPARPVIENTLLRGLVSIAPVLLLIAVCLTVVCQTEHFELVLLVALLCYRGRQYKPMLAAFAIMLLYCGYMTYAQWNLSDIPATGFDLVGCGVFAILTVITLAAMLHAMLRNNTDADTYAEDVDATQILEEDDATQILGDDADEELDATRPLNKRVRDVLEEDQTIPVSSGDSQENVEEKTQAFAADVPQEFRETQQQIFDAEISAAEMADDMAADPDTVAAEPDDMAADPDDLDETRIL